LNTDDGHFEPNTTKSNGVKHLIAFGAVDCPAGIYTWHTSGGTVQPSLSLPSRPGRLLDVRRVGDQNNFVWIFNLESSCVLTNVAKTYVQSGTQLIANGDL
jgi:hypothetical protein